MYSSVCLICSTATWQENAEAIVTPREFVGMHAGCQPMFLVCPKCAHLIEEEENRGNDESFMQYTLRLAQVREAELAGKVKLPPEATVA